jgi:methylenetetrahydrofolate dehydrogenase (NADP+)/methenyltetrahydrofolate cyclohydrolase
MVAEIIDGRALSRIINKKTADQIKSMGVTPHLAIILANNTPASRIYVDRKIKACADVGIEPILHDLPATVSEADLLSLISKCNSDPAINGIIVQLPLGDHLNSNRIIQKIDTKKDVDGLTAVNIGKVMVDDENALVPCTPQGVMAILKSIDLDLSGKHAVIIGRSLLFGKPMGQLLLNADCTVTQCHSKTVDLPSLTHQADIVIAAAGQPKIVKADWVKDGAVVIDVGINRMDDGTISGDVDFDAVQHKASYITPVPGGVGPMTVACLLTNTMKATQRE